uniref:ADP,ATP carrier protein n=1 Tax=Pyramimonas obovata TaxID=1411642 RepID=A0A7S0QZ58_9CHLO|mmetsp:Transcript_22171/g.48657  ORF Transcript_22171/g.48657 Transcript_22171/m.48657 type:complete len:100 (+) Transcript_22171:365-664(+)|eukprot:CAMPEP_0118955840 /NCGR_PEP_ID=MMETSP1169-20130426/60596_1 /TAXON_ID=36882 /ORGANISM="Pyramimonas obovata, Strain CCMP722" /LENGTH=99 /DNA_ID=CAMNT_0006903755 /DNA_START=362 /DNA_END=661 /DNA_ORIENTATION=+
MPGTFGCVIGRAVDDSRRGAAASGQFWSSMLPVDGAKTCIQAALPGSPDDISLRAHLSRVYRERGVRGWYAGLQPVVLRAFPANACQWLTFELAMQAML